MLVSDAVFVPVPLWYRDVEVCVTDLLVIRNSDLDEVFLVLIRTVPEDWDDSHVL